MNTVYSYHSSIVYSLISLGNVHLYHKNLVTNEEIRQNISEQKEVKSPYIERMTHRPPTLDHIIIELVYVLRIEYKKDNKSQKLEWPLSKQYLPEKREGWVLNLNISIP